MEDLISNTLSCGSRILDHDWECIIEELTSEQKAKGYISMYWKCKSCGKIMI